MNEELSKELRDIIEGLKKEVADRKAEAEKPAKAGRPRKDVMPDWVKDWNRANASTGQVKHIMKTDPKTGVAEKVLPVVVVPVKPRAPIAWDERPTSSAVPPRGLTNRELAEWEIANPGKPLNLKDEGPTKPSRKQLLAMNKVWKYRNFKHCLHCSEFYTKADAELANDPKLVGKLKKGTYDTWESRTDPHDDKLGVRLTHAEIWCHTCGCVDLEVAKTLPAHIGTWTPPKEGKQEREKRLEREAYRRERTIFSLKQSPKTVPQLCDWFRTVELYEGVDFIMLDLMLNKMRAEGLVVLVDGKWRKRQSRT